MAEQSGAGATASDAGSRAPSWASSETSAADEVRRCHRKVICELKGVAPRVRICMCVCVVRVERGCVMCRGTRDRVGTVWQRVRVGVLS